MKLIKTKSFIALIVSLTLTAFITTYWYSGTYLRYNNSQWFMKTGNLIFAEYGLIAMLFTILYCLNYLITTENLKEASK
ncbi:hypothetical protein LCGC14_1215070 [marine sediment metagenome]|uniref:Uncharacterized protein n=1 Tax=marine sediment metagenome TaxID=412755 RepID=A0A0F9M0E4_9ZZZZ